MSYEEDSRIKGTLEERAGYELRACLKRIYLKTTLELLFERIAFEMCVKIL